MGPLEPVGLVYFARSRVFTISFASEVMCALAPLAVDDGFELAGGGCGVVVGT